MLDNVPAFAEENQFVLSGFRCKYCARKKECGAVDLALHELKEVYNLLRPYAVK